MEFEHAVASVCNCGIDTLFEKKNPKQNKTKSAEPGFWIISSYDTCAVEPPCLTSGSSVNYIWLLAYELQAPRIYEDKPNQARQLDRSGFIIELIHLSNFQQIAF